MTQDVSVSGKEFAFDAQSSLLQICSEFIFEFDQYVPSNGSRDEFQMQLWSVYRKFPTIVRGTKPWFGTPEEDSVEGTICNNIFGLITLILLGFSIEKVRSMIHERRIYDLPGSIPSSVYEQLIYLFVSKWSLVCLDLFHSVEMLLGSFSEHLCDKYFNRFRTSGLHEHVK